MKKHYKLLTLLAAPVLAVSFITGCGSDDTASKDTAKSQLSTPDGIEVPVPVDETTAQEEIVLKTPGEAIESGAAAVKDKAENVAENIGDSSEEMMDAVAEKADEAEKSTGAMMETMGEKMQE